MRLKKLLVRNLLAHEVAQAHEGATIFDQSTFGKIEVEGKDAARFLNRICANNMDRKPGRAIYTAMLNERGGIESDLTVNRVVIIILEDKNATPLGSEPFYIDGHIAGKTTSAAYGYRVGRPVIIADRSHEDARIEGARVEVDIAGKLYAGQVTLQSAFDPMGQRMKLG